MICCTYNTAEVRVPIKHILLSSALLKNNLLQKQKSTFCLSKVTCVREKTTTLMWSWQNLYKTTIFLMVDNVSSHQSLWWEILFFVQKICYNLTVSVTLYYTLANIDPYRSWHTDRTLTTERVLFINNKPTCLPSNLLLLIDQTPVLPTSQSNTFTLLSGAGSCGLGTDFHPHKLRAIESGLIAWNIKETCGVER